MRYAIVKKLEENGANTPVGFGQWGRSIDAVLLNREEVILLHKKSPFDVIHISTECKELLEISLIASGIKDICTDTFLILSVEEPINPALDREYKKLFSFFDLILCSNDDLYVFCRRNAPEGCMGKTETAPVNLSYFEKKIISQEIRDIFVVINDSYSFWKLIRDLGFKLCKELFLEYKIRFVKSTVSDDELIQAIASSKYVFVPEPLYDSARTVVIAALCNTMAIAHPSCDGAKGVFPYTIFDPDKPELIKYTFKWLMSAKDFQSSFMENSFNSLVNFNGGNKRDRLLNYIKYKNDLPANGRFICEGNSQSSLSLNDNIKLLKGSEQFNYDVNEFVVVCLLKDGEEHLTDFLKHYRKLGCRQFIFIDNGSEDNTIEILSCQQDVILYTTSLSHKYYEIEIRRIIAEKYCRNRWCLWVDIDELFDYPYSSMLSMNDLLEYLSVNNYNAMLAPMLDMFSVNEVTEEQVKEIGVKDVYAWYDISTIKRKPYFDQTNIAYNANNSLHNPDVCCFWGGIRKQIFPAIEHDNILTKHPLIYLDGDLDPITNAHFSDKARVADVTGVLYHYKFVPSFRKKVMKSHAARNYVKFAQNEYDAYYQYLNGKQSFYINTPTSRKLSNVNELIDTGFILVTEAYLNFVKSSEEMLAFEGYNFLNSYGE